MVVQKTPYLVCLFIAGDMRLLRRCLVAAACICSTIPAFSSHVTVYILIARSGEMIIVQFSDSFCAQFAEYLQIVKMLKLSGMTSKPCNIIFA
jgi:hypothetical protein